MAPHPIATAGEALVSQVEKKLVFDSQPVKDVETSTPTIAERPSLRTVFPPLVLEEHPIDTVPRIKVVVIGAGIAGINAGILLPRKVPDIDLVILERHADLVGLGFYCTVHPFKNPMLIPHRVEPGIPTSTQASNATSHPTSTRAPLHRKPPGPRITHLVLRSRHTGRRSLRSTTLRNTYNTTLPSHVPIGLKRRQNGYCKSSRMG